MNEPQTTNLVTKLRNSARIYASESPEDLGPEQMLDWQAADEIERLQAAIVGAQIALARDEDISAAMRILVATGVQNG